MDRKTLIKALDFWCGRGDDQEMELCEVQQLESVAALFQITEVVSELEDAVMGLLSLRLGACEEVLMWSKGCGMLQLEAEAVKLAAERFEEFALWQDSRGLGRRRWDVCWTMPCWLLGARRRRGRLW